MNKNAGAHKEKKIENKDKSCKNRNMQKKIPEHINKHSESPNNNPRTRSNTDKVQFGAKQLFTRTATSRKNVQDQKMENSKIQRLSNIMNWKKTGHMLHEGALKFYSVAAIFVSCSETGFVTYRPL